MCKYYFLLFMLFLEQFCVADSKIMFSGKLVYNKLVANLLIYFVSKFIWLSNLKVMEVTSSCCKVLALWIFQDSQPTLCVLSIFGLGIILGCLKVNCRKFTKLSRKYLFA